MCLFSESILKVEKLHNAKRRAFLLWVSLMWALQPFLDPFMKPHWGQLHFLLPSILVMTGSSRSSASCFTFTGEDDGVGALEVSMGDGVDGCDVGVGVDIPFRLLSSWDRSSGPALSQASSNKCHPSAIVLLPSDTIWWPAATDCTATNEDYTLVNISVWHVWHLSMYLHL